MAKVATVNWLLLTTPMPNWESVKKPTANWPRGIIHTAGTGAQFTLYLKEMSIHVMQRKVALV